MNGLSPASSSLLQHEQPFPNNTEARGPGVTKACMDGWIFLPSTSTAVRKPGPLSILCAPVCCRYIPPHCARVTDKRKCLLWLTVTGYTVHSSRDAGAWGSWSHSICSRKPERDDCLYSFSFLFSQEPQTMEQCHPESEGVFPPFLKYPHRHTRSLSPMYF